MRVRVPPPVFIDFYFRCMTDSVELEGYTVFVYGTLRTGASNAFRMRGAQSLGAATLGARLYRVHDAFPGIVLDDYACLQGEVFTGVSEVMLHALDVYEGCDAGMPEEERIYRRVKVVATLCSEEEREVIDGGGEMLYFNDHGSAEDGFRENEEGIGLLPRNQKNGEILRCAASLHEYAGRTSGADGLCSEAFQDGAIQRWAAAEGLLIRRKPDALLKSPPDNGRNEHDIWTEPEGFQGKLIKVPKGGCRTIISTSPVDYLQRWAWIQEVFGLNSYLYGVTEQGEFILVQDFIVGQHFEDHAQLVGALEGLGWHQIGTSKWLTPDKMWVVEDVGITNILVQPNGSLVPIDIDLEPSTKQLQGEPTEEEGMFSFFNEAKLSSRPFLKRREVKCWVWEYVKPVAEKDLIKSGDWLLEVG